MPHTDSASRLIHASSAQVYAALTDPSALAVWLPPSNMVGSIEHFDLRPGGSYRMVLSYVDGSSGKSTEDSDIVEVQFVELVPDTLVVESVEFVSDDPQFAGTMTMTWEILARGEDVHVEVTAAGVPDGISGTHHAEGMDDSLKQLERYLHS